MKNDKFSITAPRKSTHKLRELVDLFERNEKQYTSGAYDEANTKIDFIDKFFELLDWDVRNEQQFAEAYREVVREDKVKIEGKQKAPDYSFRIGGTRKFFVEAKKPSVNIKNNISAAYQLRRYAYSAKLPLSILTDFQEFAVYDTRIKPRPRDNASIGRIFYCKFDAYPENFDYIFSTFSKEAILKGSFDKYVLDTKKKKGTSEVDKEFLKLIEGWRSELAKNIAIRNKEIDLYNLNIAVQRIIDRIIFLRIAEDRNIEEYGALEKIKKDGNLYKKLDGTFQQARKKYDSSLFLNEAWLSDLVIDDDVLTGIIKSLYYPESPYEFSVLPVEILGNIYEQFLGKVIILTASRQARIQEKPEVKKAGGVYYTPQYIVDHIVENTVGEIINGKTPNRMSQIRILDPACGSGSFLIGAYNYLMKSYLDYYTKENNLKTALRKHKIYQAGENNYKLTINEKREILLNNVFGVDIDIQAVEVTKLSLLLKLMEDENAESAGQLFKYSDLTLLPNLSNNIKCGNSLISKEFFENKNLSLFNTDEMRKINPFEWSEEFKEVFDKGGFDAVIGNPPYIDSEGMVKSGQKQIRDFISDSYEMAKGNWDIYIAFIERGFSFLNKNGALSYITPDKWLVKPFGDEIRKKMIKHICTITHAGRNVFENAKVDSIITKISKKTCNKLSTYVLENGKKLLKNSVDKKILKAPYKLDSLFGDHLGLIMKVDSFPATIGSIAICENACATSDAYKLKPLVKNSSVDNFNEERHFKIVNTGTIDKFFSKWGNREMTYLGDKYLFPVADKKAFLNEFKNSYSKKTVKPKIIIKGLTLLDAFIDESGVYIPGKSTLIITSKDIEKLKLILGILNSKLAQFYLKEKYPSSSYNQGINFTKEMIDNFPIPEISRPERRKIVDLVEQMIEVKEQFYLADSDADKNALQQKIEIMDGQINKEVYRLFRMDNNEIKIIEEGIN